MHIVLSTHSQSRTDGWYLNGYQIQDESKYLKKSEIKPSL